MFPWLMVWAPQLHFPWSGNVAQQIDPDWFFDAIGAQAGNGEIEKKAFDVASYGRQLGLLTEVLIELADKQRALPGAAATSLARLKEIRDRIEVIKQEEASTTVHKLEAQLRQLQKSNPEEFARLSTRLRPLLA